MLAVLIAVRDFLLAVALAWIGVSVEPRGNTDAAGCSGDSCQVQRDR